MHSIKQRENCIHVKLSIHVGKTIRIWLNYYDTDKFINTFTHNTGFLIKTQDQMFRITAISIDTIHFFFFFLINPYAVRQKKLDTAQLRCTAYNF